ncbi:MAG: hypothetical protein CMJ40_10460 [Phycisphaerae bacterium]|nr:hypothetical protein [Phycisphaerae bacterium]|tara:strand:+ start:4795 stop:5586 length:792 start_codon:yes stop_codon:yes gene_type:complete
MPASKCSRLFADPSVRTNGGFTLVELMAVIVILALLLGVLIPSMQSISHQSLVTADLGNLRSLQSAHYQYAVDSKGKFADAGLSHGGLANEKIAWLNTLGAYVDIKGIIRSPLDTSPHWEMPIEGTTNRYRRTSYGWNNYLSRTKSPAAAIDPRSAADRLSRVSSPANTVHFLHMVATGDFAGSDHVHVENWWISDAMPGAPAILAANHVQTNVVAGEAKTNSAKANYGFVDGSVQTLYFSDVFLRPDRNRFDPEIAGRLSFN